MSNEASSLVVTVMSAGEDLDRYSRRLAALVNQSSLHLAQVISRGSQIYPVRNDIVGARPVVLDCEFRPRQAGASISHAMVEDLMRRLEGLDVSVVTVIDAAGRVIERIGEHRVAG